MLASHSCASLGAALRAAFDSSFGGSVAAQQRVVDSPRHLLGFDRGDIAAESQSMHFDCYSGYSYQIIRQVGSLCPQDRPGKLGWVSEGACSPKVTDSLITFRMRLSKTLPRLAVTFLETYKNAGRADVTVAASSTTGLAAASVSPVVTRHEPCGMRACFEMQATCMPYSIFCVFRIC